MAVGGGGVEALFWRGPVTPGDNAVWLESGVLYDAGTSGGGAAGVPETIFLSSNAVFDNAGNGTVIGNLSVVSGTGTYTLALQYNPNSLFALNGTTLSTNTNFTAGLDGMNPIVVKATNGGVSPTFYYGITVYVFPAPSTGYVPTYHIYGF